MTPSIPRSTVGARPGFPRRGTRGRVPRGSLQRGFGPDAHAPALREPRRCLTFSRHAARIRGSRLAHLQALIGGGRAEIPVRARTRLPELALTGLHAARRTITADDRAREPIFAVARVVLARIRLLQTALIRRRADPNLEGGLPTRFDERALHAVRSDAARRRFVTAVRTALPGALRADTRQAGLAIRTRSARCAIFALPRWRASIKRSALIKGRNLATVFEIWMDMLKDDTTIFLGVSGAMTAGGMKAIVRYLIENRFIDCLVSTGANLFHDVYESDRKSTRLNSSHIQKSRMPSSA